MPAWPVTLPQSPLLASFSGTAGVNVARFQPDIGPAITRRRSTYRPDKLNVSYVLSTAQAGTFETFWHTTLADGALSYTLPDPRPWGGTIAVRPLDGSYDLSRHEDTPDWLVSFTVELMP